MTKLETELLAAGKEIDRLSLVIESAVRWSDAIHHAAVEAALLANRAAIAKATGEAPGPDARCSLCGKPADFTGPCGWGGCPLGADL